MDDDTIQDLKQFIAAVISQQTSDLREDITGIHEDISEIRKDITRLDNKLVTLDAKVDDISSAIADALEASNSETDQRLKDHESRIFVLEQKAV